MDETSNPATLSHNPLENSWWVPSRVFVNKHFRRCNTLAISHKRRHSALILLSSEGDFKVAYFKVVLMINFKEEKYHRESFQQAEL